MRVCDDAASHESLIRAAYDLVFGSTADARPHDRSPSSAATAVAALASAPAAADPPVPLVPLAPLASGSLACIIGTIHSFRYDYTFKLTEPTSGWRSKRETAGGGGVVLDMGYHALDIVSAFFGPAHGCCVSVVDANFEHQYASTRAEGLEDRGDDPVEVGEDDTASSVSTNKHTAAALADTGLGTVHLNRHAMTKGGDLRFMARWARSWSTWSVGMSTTR